MADILGKATESVPKEEVKDNNPHLKNLYEGLTMTEAQLLKVCKSFTNLKKKIYHPKNQNMSVTKLCIF